MPSPLELILELNDSKFRKGADRVKKQLTGVEKEAKDSTKGLDKLEKSTNKTGGSFGSFAKSIVRATAVMAAFGAALRVFKVLDDIQSSMNKVDAAFRNATNTFGLSRQQIDLMNQAFVRTSTPAKKA